MDTRKQVFRLLLVEDNPLDARLIERMLEGSFTVACATSLHAGIEQMEGGGFHVLLLDLSLPDSTGADTVRAACASARDLPVVVLTATEDEGLELLSLQCGAQDFLNKARLDRDRLRRTLRHAIERKTLLRRLEAGEKRFRRVLDATEDAIVLTDHDGRILFYNPPAEVLFGRPLLGEIFGHALWPGGTSRVTVTRDGETRLAEMRVSESEWDGEPALLALLRDHTDQVRADAQLARARQLESIGILAGGIAHDFNNFLTSIFLNVHLAKRMAPADGQLSLILGDIERALPRAKDLTHQLLTFSRGGAPVRTAAHIGEVIRDSVGFVLRGSNVSCDFDVADDLWPLDADAGQISQVIHNLIINAVQAMPDGGVLRVVAFNQEADARSVCIRVQDQGVGIDAADLPRIFDPYFTTKEKGSGLGLLTSASIVKNHGGAITVRSTPGQGTVFEITLPASLTPPSPPSPSTERLRDGRGRVLVMDDDDAIRRVLGQVLIHMGYQVDFAAEGAEAVAKYEKARGSGKPFDVVILDLTIPGGMGGKDAINQLKVIDPAVKAIASSAYANDPAIVHPQRYGFQTYVTKPYTVQELTRALASVSV